MDSEVEYNLSKFADGTKLCGACQHAEGKEWAWWTGAGQPLAPGSHTATKGGVQSVGKTGLCSPEGALGRLCNLCSSLCFHVARDSTLSKRKVKKLHFILQPPRVGKDIENSGTRGPASSALPCIPFHTCCWPPGLRMSGCCSAMSMLEAILSATWLSTDSPVIKMCNDLLRDKTPPQALSRKLK